MAGHINVVLLSLAIAVSGASPAQQYNYPHHESPQVQQINQLEYHIAHPGLGDFYRPVEQKQVVANRANEESSRLETLEPDSEVELVPGVQPPQQPPQQNPVAPHIPGLYPGQRVFIVHMPVPGYRPGTIGGYQPVYVVAAGAQGNLGYPGNGFQNAILLDPSGQPVVSPFVGYGGRGIVSPQYLGAPLHLQRPYDLVYQEPGPANAGGPILQGNAGKDAIHFSNVIGLQGPLNPAAYQGPVVALQNQIPNKQGVSAAQVQQKQPIERTKESVEQKPNHRSSPVLLRNKA